MRHIVDIHCVEEPDDSLVRLSETRNNDICLHAFDASESPNGARVILDRKAVEDLVEAAQKWLQEEPQLAKLHRTPQSKLASVILDLKHPLPQVVFHVSEELAEQLDQMNAEFPGDRWWWFDEDEQEWCTGSVWFITGTCATPGESPGNGATALEIGTMEDLHALVKVYSGMRIVEYT